MIHVPLMFQLQCREFTSAPCLAGKKLVDSSRLDVVEIGRVSWHASFQPLEQEKLPIRHMKKLLFPTKLSIPSYDNGKYVGLRNYQHPLVIREFLYIQLKYDTISWRKLRNVNSSTRIILVWCTSLAGQPAANPCGNIFPFICHVKLSANATYFLN